MHKHYKKQSGLALIMFLTIFLLSATAILLSRLNNRTSVMLEKQAQTARVLAQAKEALIGYAATYVETHSSLHKIQQGFLPCPDYNGDGSANSPCGDAGHSVIGRFPWRSLGLPPLRDGSGECLWYAISGTYKNSPKITPPLITNNIDGLFIVKNVNDMIIAGNTPEDQAIAIIFAPGRPIGEQNRKSTNTICGEDEIATNYLDDFYFDAFNGIGNARGDKDISNDANDDVFKKRDLISTKFWVTANPEDTPTFIQAPFTKTGFNDTLMLITPKDFEPVYEGMNYWVAKQVTRCLDEYGKEYSKVILSHYETQMTAYKTKYATRIANYQVQCEEQCDAKITCTSDCTSECQLICGTGTLEECITCKSECALRESECDECKSDCEEALTTNNKYSWASKLNSLPNTPDVDYFDQKNSGFGRIPDNMVQSISAINDVDDDGINDIDISSKWPATLNGESCFDRSAGLAHHEWGWWKEWREEVFFAVDELHEPSATTYIWVKNNFDKTLCTMSLIVNNISGCPVGKKERRKLKNKLTINSTRKQSLVVMVAGRKLELASGKQERISLEEKKDIKNYLEPDNVPVKQNFMSKWATDDFNDAVCGIAGIESGGAGEIYCVNPP
jgi:hypothetical protein